MKTKRTNMEPAIAQADLDPGCFFVVDGPWSSTGLSWKSAHVVLRERGRGTVISVPPADEDEDESY